MCRVGLHGEQCAAVSGPRLKAEVLESGLGDPIWAPQSPEAVS